MESLLGIFKSLGDRNRLRIVAALLQEDELCACQIIEMLGVAGATASRHLAQLHAAGIVESRKEGRWNYFRINPIFTEAFPLNWLENRLARTPELEKDRKLLESILAVDPEVICRKQRGE